VPHLLVDVTLDAAGSTEAPVRIGLESLTLPPVVRAEIADGATAVLPVEWASTGRIAFAVPVDLGVPVSDVTVSSETGVSELTATAGSETVEFTGSLGSIGLVAGAGATMEGSHTSPTGTATPAAPPTGTVPAAFTGTVSATAGGVHTVTGLSDLLSGGPLQLTNTTQGFSCTATASGSGFTCPAEGKTWASTTPSRSTPARRCAAPAWPHRRRWGPGSCAPTAPPAP
jgi:hypothetical protein